MNGHMVPRSYLRKFADNNDILFALNKRTAESFPTNVKNVLAERNFYIIPPHIAEKTGLPPDLIEGGYARMVDNDLMKEMHALGECPTGLVDYDLLVRAAQFLMIQYFRTRSTLDLTRELLTKTMQNLVDELVRVNFGEDHLRFSPIASVSELLASVYISELVFKPERSHHIVASLCHRQWKVWTNTTKVPLFTSDQPAVLHALDNGFKGLALLSPRTKIYLPLSSWCLVEVSDRPGNPGRPSLARGCLSRSQVGSINRLQILQSDRTLICERDEFNQAKEYLRLMPSLRESAPPLVAIKNVASRHALDGTIRTLVETTVGTRDKPPADAEKLRKQIVL